MVPRGCKYKIDNPSDPFHDCSHSQEYYNPPAPIIIHINNPTLSWHGYPVTMLEAVI